MADYILGKGYLWQGSAAVSRGVFVKAGTVAQSATLATAITDVAIGVLQESISAADAATGKLVVPVWIPGSVSRMVASEPIPKGSKVAPTVTTGRARVAVSTQFPAGIAQSAAAAAGDEIDVLLFAGAVVI